MTFGVAAIIATPFEFSACAHSALHQADNLAKLRQEFLSMLELIVKIFCAVEIAKTSEVSGNRHCVFVSL